jgi:dihydrofolate synthase / folylpolyglutamate synthase
MMINPSLDRIRALVERLGFPQERFDSVLVAGTNGKGTCAATLDAILRASVRPDAPGAPRASAPGVALYTSPHLIRETERLRVGGREVTRELLDEALGRVDRVARADVPVAPSPFERLTAAAFLVFRDAGVTRAVLEVGLGGRWDACAVARADLGLITSIGRDHVAWLGETLEEIAAEKAAIARPGMTLLSAVERRLHDAVIAPVATGLGAKVLHLDDSGWSSAGARAQALQSPFPGVHALRNAALAALAAEQLGVEEAQIARGVAATRWPGRFDTLAQDPLLIADVAHNVDSFRALLAVMRERHPRVPFQLLFAAKPDKELSRIAPFLSGLADMIHVFGAEGASGPHELADPRGVAETLRVHNLRAVSRGGLDQIPSVVRALRADGVSLLACGSHQLVGAVMRNEG